MSISLEIPAALRDCADGRRVLTLSTTTIQSAIDEVESVHPALYRNLCDDTGALRVHLNLFLNGSHVRDRKALNTQLNDGDVITILTAVSGG